jgi:hypothetical protein
MMLAHVIGIPVEESVLQLAPAGAAIVTAVAIAARATLGRLRRQLPHGHYIREGAHAKRRSLVRSRNGTPTFSSVSDRLSGRSAGGER